MAINPISWCSGRHKTLVRSELEWDSRVGCSLYLLNEQEAALPALAVSSASTVAEGPHWTPMSSKLAPASPSSIQPVLHRHSGNIGCRGWVPAPRPLQCDSINSHQEESGFLCRDPVEAVSGEGSASIISYSDGSLVDAVCAWGSDSSLPHGVGKMQYCNYRFPLLLYCFPPFTVNFLCSAASHRTNTGRQ